MLSRRSVLALPLALCTRWEECDVGNPVVQRLLPTIACIGESLTSGSKSTGGEGSVNSYPGVIATTRQQGYGSTVLNLGVSGIGIDTLLEPEVFQVANGPNVHVVMEGVNDLVIGGMSGAILFSKFQTYVNARLAAGSRVVACTLTAFAGSGSIQAQRLIYNAAIRAAYTGGLVAGVTFCDVAANANIGDGATIPGSYFDADATHLNDAGYAILAGLINACIDASWQVSATLTTASGAPLLSAANSIAGWWRPDWSQRNPVHNECYAVMNIAAKQCWLRHMVENDPDDAHTPVNRIDSVLNGKSCMRFPGNQSGGTDLLAFMQSSTTLASFVTSTSLLFACVINPTTITANNVNPHFNEGVMADSSGTGAGITLRNNGGTLQVQGWVDDGAKQVIPLTLTGGLGTPVAIFMKLTGGFLSLKLGTQGSYTTIAAGAIATLSSPMRLGKASLNCGNFDGFDFFAGQYNATDEANIGAMIRARYGSSL